MSTARPRSSARIHPDGAADELTPTPSFGVSPSVKRRGTGDASSDVAAWSRAASVKRTQTRIVSRKERLAEEEESKLVNAPEAEHAEWLAKQARVGGRAGAMDMWRFYLKMHIPILYICLIYFGIFAGFSYAIPNLLCNGVAKENSAASFGMTECIFNDLSREGGYSVRWGAKTFWLVFWSFVFAYIPFYPVMVTWAITGNAFTKREKWVAGLIIFLSLIMLPIMGPQFGIGFNNFGVTGASIIACFINLLVTAHVIRRYTGSKQAGSRWFFFFLSAGQVVTFYKIFLPMMITRRANDVLGGMGLTIVRLVVHPAIWAVVLMWFRFVMRNIGYVPEMMMVVFLVWPVLYSSMYGRFLLLSLDNVGSVVVMNLIFACFDLAGKLGDRGTDGYFLKLLFGERGRDAIVALRDTDDRRMAEVFTSCMMEMASIFAASALFSFGGIALAPGVRPNQKSIWFNALAQAVTNFVFGFLGMVLEGKYHNFEWRKSWTTQTKKLMAMLTIIALVSGGPLCCELLSLFCPVYYEKEGIVLLEQCDKPSIFQAITFSSADRFKLVGDMFNITAGESVNHQ